MLADVGVRLHDILDMDEVAGEVLPQVVKGQRARISNVKRPLHTLRERSGGTSPLEEEAAGDDEVAGSSPAPPTSHAALLNMRSPVLWDASRDPPNE
jgi:hypothetical protein